MTRLFVRRALPGGAALAVTLWLALSIGLHAPALRPVPVAPWAGARYDAEATVPDAARLIAFGRVSPCSSCSGTSPQSGIRARSSSRPSHPPARSSSPHRPSGGGAAPAAIAPVPLPAATLPPLEPPSPGPFLG